MFISITRRHVTPLYMKEQSQTSIPSCTHILLGSKPVFSTLEGILLWLRSKHVPGTLKCICVV